MAVPAAVVLAVAALLLVCGCAPTIASADAQAPLAARVAAAQHLLPALGLRAGSHTSALNETQREAAAQRASAIAHGRHRRGGSEEPPIYCKVSNTITGEVPFDLSPLFRKTGEANYAATDDRGHVYYMNVCGYLNPVGGAKRCAQSFNDTRASACQDKPDDPRFPYHIGTASTPELTNPEKPSEGVTLVLHSSATDQHVCDNGARRNAKILFTCGNSRGRPVFLEENDPCSYTFKWETDLVCEGVTPSANEVPCFVEAGQGSIVDLSPLVSSAMNWRALDETTNGDSYMYYLSVCSTLVPSPGLPEGCDTSTSGACQYKTNEPDRTPVSLGHPASPRYAGGEITITYEMGDPCGSSGMNRKAQVFFTCPSSRVKGLGSPKFREEINCYYIFDWETTAACTLTTSQSTGGCSVTDENDNTYDLSALKHRTYTVEYEDTQFEVGVCGSPVKCGANKKSAAVCMTDMTNPSNPSSTVLSTSTSGVSVTNGDVQVSYAAATVDGATVDILTTFVCNPAARPDVYEAELASLVDMDMSGGQLRALVFEVETSLVCVKQVECALEANGRSYDLSPLARDSYWRIDTDEYSYLINVCKGVVAPSLGCEGTGGCQLLHDNKGTSYALGQVAGPRMDGTALVLDYTNGSRCGSSDVWRSMTITFECDESAGLEGSLLALEEKEMCHYEFLWQTSAACPLGRDTEDGCRVTDGRTGQTFDLTKLASKLKHRDLHISSDQRTYHVGLCGANSYCGGDVAVCDSSRTSYGEANAELSFNQDSLYLTYRNGETCGSGQHRATAIQFRCAEEDGEDGPQVLSDDDCLLELEWPTRFACSEEFETMDCIAHDGNRRFDISRLIDSTANYFAEDDEAATTFFINVCRPMVPDTERLCPFGAAACAVAEDNNAISLGKPGNEPVYDAAKDLVYIDYFNGTDGASSRIEFVCPERTEDPDSLNTLFFLGREEESNKYLFRIRSRAACQRVLVRGSKCKVTDSITGMEMDLSPLTKETPYEVHTKKYTYQINVCKDVPCGDSGSNPAGACQMDGSGHAYHLGEANSQPLFDNNVLQLSYEHGQPCHDKTVFRRTVILFVCDLEEEVGQPEFLHEDDNCMYIFQWRTQHACKPQITHCGAVDPDTGAEYHLDALVRQDYSIAVYERGTASSSNWLALDDADDVLMAKYAFRINVCRPLVPDSTITCGPFAAACQTDLDSRNHYTIGYPLQGPQVVDGHLQLHYTLGDSAGCSKPRTATIEFSCDPTPGALGTPVFEYEGEDCDYHFSWSSAAACPQGGGFGTTSTSTSGPDTGQGACHFLNHVTGETIDLSNLGNDGLLFTTGHGRDGTEYDFYVGICQESEKADLRECSGMGACQMADGLTVGLGKANHHLFMENDQLMLQYTDGKPCVDKSPRKTTIFFRCDHAETDTPRLEYIEETDDCEYRFEVYTERVCSRVRQTSCSAIDFNQPTTPIAYDLSPLMQQDQDYAVEIPDPNSMGGTLGMLTINVCRSLVQPAVGCENFYSACLARQGSGHGEPLGLPASPYVTEDHQLRMEYVSPGCEGGSAATTNTTIIFQCSSDGEEHEPVLVSPPSRGACAFLVVWETPYACAPGDGKEGGSSSTTTTAAPGSLTREDCVVANEYDRFDLSGLGTEKATVLKEADGKEYEYHVSACGSVACRNKDGKSAAVCQSDGKSAWSLGQFTQRPKLEAGHEDQVKLLYESGSECKDKERSSRVTFKCERNKEHHGPVFEAETDTCEYEFTWYTDAVCPNKAIPHHALGCSVADPETGRVYHLDALMRSNDVDENWLARDAAADEEGDSGGGFNFYINVCRPLVPTPIDSGDLSEVCRGSGVCQVTADGRAFSGGYAMHEPEFDASGDVVLRYSLPHSHETKCHGTFTRSASIRFTCKEGTHGHPVFIGETEECEYMFEWATSVVCEYKQSAGHGCQVADQETGTQYDLTPLQGLLVETHAGGYTYELAVCSSPNRGSFSGCTDTDDEDVGACQSRRGYGSYNMGRINAKPFVTAAGVALEYTDGDLCHDRKFQRSTYIEFVCASGMGAGKPEFVEELEDCSYVFRWATEYACERQTDFECVITDKQGREYDLSPLKRTTGNWLVDNTGGADEYTYLLNVCHNVVLDGPAENCTGNAGACQWSSATHGSYNLGHPSEPAFVDGRLRMTLEGGTPCNGKPRKTVVTFECKQPDGSGEPLGTPQFDREDDCEYHILWQTSAACPVDATAAPTTDECVFEDRETGAVFDLTQVSPALLEFSDGGDMQYSLNLCNTLSCDGRSAFACQYVNHKEFSLGRRKAAIMSDGSLTLHLTGGTRCKSVDKERETFVTFECPEDGIDTSELVSVDEEHKCTYEMVVRTQAACGASPGECVVKDNTHAKGWEYDLSPLSVDGSISVETEDGVIDFNVCRGVSREGCDADAGACLTKDGKHYTLGRFTEDTRPEMMQDKPQVHLMYKGGSCPHGARSSVEIIFRCPTDKSKQKDPVLLRSPGCVYQIEWETCRVCPGENPCDDVRTTHSSGSSASPQTTDSGQHAGTQGGSSGSGHKKRVVAAVVIVVVLVVVVGAFLLMNPGQRQRIALCFGGGGGSGTGHYHRMKNLQSNVKERLFSDESESEEEALFGIGNNDSSDDDGDSDAGPFLPSRATDDAGAAAQTKKSNGSSGGGDASSSKPVVAANNDSSSSSSDDDDDKPLIPL